MVQMRTWLTVADNSGARQITCILPLGGDAGLKAGLGDVITAAVKEATPDGQVKKGVVVRAVVVRLFADTIRAAVRWAARGTSFRSAQASVS